MTAFFLINIGNTHTQFACMASGESWTVPTADLRPEAFAALPFHTCPLPRQWVAASVVPAMRPLLGQLATAAGADLHWITADDLSGIDCSGIDMTTVGADRLANLAAGVALLEPPAVIVDCGTAITTEVIGPGPRFHGGAILPGRRMQRRALGTFTGLLPDAPLGSSCPRAVGTTTQEAILAGIDTGILAAVETLIRRTAQELKFSTWSAWATGGDAPFFCSHLPILKPAPPDFTLKGLATIGNLIYGRKQEETKG